MWNFRRSLMVSEPLFVRAFFGNDGEVFDLMSSGCESLFCRIWRIWNSSEGEREKRRESFWRDDFTLRTQKSILKTKVYQYKLSLGFAAALIFSIWPFYFCARLVLVSQFSPVKCWNETSSVPYTRPLKIPRRVIKN